MLSHAKKHRVARVSRWAWVRWVLALAAIALVVQLLGAYRASLSVWGRSTVRSSSTLMIEEGVYTLTPSDWGAARRVGQLDITMDVLQTGSRKIWRKSVTMGDVNFVPFAEFRGESLDARELARMALTSLSVQSGGMVAEAVPFAIGGETVEYFRSYRMLLLDMALTMRPWLVIDAVAGGVLLGAILVVRRWTRGSLHLMGHCRACGYDLAGVPGTVCPECGEATQVA